MAEQELNQTGYQMKRTLQTAQIGHHQCQGGEIWMSNPLNPEQSELFKKLDLNPPPRYYKINTTEDDAL